MSLSCRDPHEFDLLLQWECRTIVNTPAVCKFCTVDSCHKISPLQHESRYVSMKQSVQSNITRL